MTQTLEDRARHILDAGLKRWEVTWTEAQYAHALKVMTASLEEAEARLVYQTDPDYGSFPSDTSGWFGSF